MSARRVAFKILKSASSGATYSNIALDNALKRHELTQADSALVTAIVMGVTERRLTLDRIISCLAKKSEQIDTDTRILLQMGLYQLLCLDRIPTYAAVNETVGLAPRRSAGFVNAILREFLRRRERGELDKLYPDENADKIAYLSVKYSFPRDFCQRFCELYGYERAKKILDVFNQPPKLTLRINTLRTTREEYLKLLSESDIEYSLSENLDNAVILRDVAFSSLRGFEEGFFFVQDEASQICVEALGAREGELVIDTCSCPGSKSFGLAINMKNRGQIYSFDLHQSKLKLVSSGALRLGIDIISASERDGRAPCEELFGKADKVLCDVPCSGLGVVAKKPEIRYKDLSEMAKLPQIQYDILSASARYLKTGGELVYSTCTVLPEENYLNIERFLSEHSHFVPCDFAIGEKRSSGGMLSLSPDIDGTDGFFIAKLKKIKEE